MHRGPPEGSPDARSGQSDERVSLKHFLLSRSGLKSISGFKLPEQEVTQLKVSEWRERREMCLWALNGGLAGIFRGRVSV